MTEDISISLNEVVLDFPTSKSGPAFLKEIFTGRASKKTNFYRAVNKISLDIKRYPQQTSTVSTHSPFTVNSNTTKKDTRARGRFVSLKIENVNASESWRFGTFRLDIQPDGRR